jgi:hypothetical protein
MDDRFGGKGLPDGYLLVKEVNVFGVEILWIWVKSHRIGDETQQNEQQSSPTLRTRSARSSKAVAPCMTTTLATISSILYASAILCTASARSLFARTDDIVALRPAPPNTSPDGPMPKPNAMAVAFALEVVPLATAFRPAFIEFNAALVMPDATLRIRSCASSISFLTPTAVENIPESIGGGSGSSGGRVGGIVC